MIYGNGPGDRSSAFAAVAMVSEAQVAQGSGAAVGEATSSQEPTVSSRSIGVATGGQDRNSQTKVGQSAGAVGDQYSDFHTSWDTVNGGGGLE